MVRILSVLALIFAFSTPVFAFESAFEHCRGHSQVAGEIMAARQSGESMEYLMEVAAEMGDLRRGTEALVRMAFDVPVMRIEANRQVEITEFSSMILAVCMDAKDPR